MNIIITIGIHRIIEILTLMVQFDLRAFSLPLIARSHLPDHLEMNFQKFLFCLFRNRIHWHSVDIKFARQIFYNMFVTGNITSIVSKKILSLRKVPWFSDTWCWVESLGFETSVSPLQGASYLTLKVKQCTLVCFCQLLLTNCSGAWQSSHTHPVFSFFWGQFSSSSSLII